MNLPLVFILIVFSLAIFSFFLQEILGIIKRIFAIPGFKLLILLVIASYIVEENVEYVSLILSYYQLVLVSVLHLVEHLFPFKLGIFFLSPILLLTALYGIPLFLVTWYKYRHPLSKLVSIWDRIGAGVWLISAITIVMA